MAEQEMRTHKNYHWAQLDVHKAYDTVDRDKLWRILLEKGFSESDVHCLRSLYADTNIEFNTGWGKADE